MKQIEERDLRVTVNNEIQGEVAESWVYDSVPPFTER